MTPEEKSLLERTYKMAEENNSILRKMRRHSRFGMVMRVLYWVAILAIAAGTFYYVQPYVDSMLGIIGQAQEVIQKANNTVNQAQSTVNSVKGVLTK